MRNLTIHEAIEIIKEAGFTPNLWEKHGKKRIYINFKFNGSKRTGGFIGRENTELIAAPCGRRTKKYQNKLNQFLELNIDWNSNETKKTITQKQVDAKVAYETSMESDYTYFGIGL